MQPIGQVFNDKRFQELLKRSPRNLPTAEEQLEMMYRSSDFLKDFHAEHLELTRDDYYRSLSTVYTSFTEDQNCRTCTDLATCPNLVKGHYSRLDVQHGQIVSAIVECDKQLAREAEIRTRRLMRSYYVSEETLAADFQGMDMDEANGKAVKAAMRFCNEVKDKRKPKGLYLHGGFGVGKSYIMGGIARELSQDNIESLMVYVPDFIREIKDSIADQTYSAKLEVLKDVPVLIFDDFGAENLTPWIRDEVLGVILHHRVNNHLPTLYTSNYSLEDLEQHLSISNGNRIENTKARRIMERIRHYADVVEIDGNNRRKNL